MTRRPRISLASQPVLSAMAASVSKSPRICPGHFGVDREKIGPGNRQPQEPVRGPQPENSGSYHLFHGVA